MSANDVFAPTFKVEVNGTDLAADVSKNIMTVEVTIEPSAMDHCSMTLANPFPDLRWTHTSDAKLFAEGSSVRIEMGYVDRRQLMFDGEITAISPSFPESGPPTVQIEGLSRLHWLVRDSKLRTFENVTDSDIASQVGTGVNLTVQADTTQTKYPYILQDNKTDLAFLLERARRIRFEVLVQGKTLLFRKAQEGQPKSYTLVWGNPQQGVAGTNVLPLRSFAPRLSPRGVPAAVVVRGQDPATGAAIKERAGAGDEDSTQGGSMTAAQLNSTAFSVQPELVLTDPPVTSTAEAAERAHAEFNRLARKLLTGRGVSIGIPDLRSGDVVELDGIGRFSGPYYVTTATHRIGGSGYETSFGVERMAI